MFRDDLNEAAQNPILYNIWRLHQIQKFTWGSSDAD